jgi:hypothetical protein
MLEWIDAGWQLGEFSSTGGVFFCTRGADLKRTFIVAMLEWIDAGWQIREFSSRTGAFFCSKGVERRMIEIAPTNPGQKRP